MKKIFIGCGVLALILLGFIGYMAYQIVPLVMDAVEAFESIGLELVDLEEDFPFDEAEIDGLDTGRFATALDFRREFATELNQLGVDIQEFTDALEEEDPSFWGFGEVFRDAWEKVVPVLEMAPSMLRRHEMASSELGWHSRVMWATLRRIDNGTAVGEATEPLKGKFEAFRRAYQETRDREKDDLPPLDDVLGDFDEGILLAAEAVFAEDIERVMEGIQDPGLEIVYLSVLTKQLDGDESGIRLRVNGKDILGEDPEDGTPPADG